MCIVLIMTIFSMMNCQSCEDIVHEFQSNKMVFDSCMEDQVTKQLPVKGM